tara:strand:- start:2891 stop:4207 length:1317 start_codon:yes stop_codon:yes gene_type:complete
VITNVIPSAVVPALQRLYSRSILEVADRALIDTVFCYSLALPSNSESKQTSVNLIPRIHLNYLREFLFKNLQESFKPNLCEIVRDLYISGLGLPVDKRLADYWRAYSVYSQPVHSGIVVTPADLLAVLDAHIEIAEKASKDGRYVYQQHVQKHFKMFSRFSYVSPFVDAYDSVKELKRTSVQVINVPKTGYEGHLVYKRKANTNEYVLYAAFVRTDNKVMPFVRQALDSPLPNTIQMESACNFITLTGKFNFLDTAKKLTPPPATLKGLWSEFVEYDLVSHSDFRPLETAEEKKLQQLLSANRPKFRKAKAYLREKPKGSKAAKAKAFISKFCKYQEKLSEISVTSDAWAILNPAQHLTFFVIDCFACDTVQGKQNLTIPYSERIDYFKTLGFRVSKVKTVKLKSTTTLMELSEGKHLPRIKIRDNSDELDLHSDWFA